MINLGTVRPGTTIYIPFDTFAAATGAPTALTNFAVGDILIYKDGGTTERASTTGFTATTSFDSLTGINLAVIDLSSDATGDFFKSGSRYFVVISPVTADAQTLSFVAATFDIGYPSAVLNTSIATLSSQTSFTLTSGPAEDDALNGMWALVHDKASAVQLAWVQVLDYTGSTKTVTLAATPAATFTIAAIDNIHFFAPSPMQPATIGRFPVVDASGLVDANAVKLGPTGAGTAQTARDLGSSVLLSTGTGTGQLDFTSGVVKANLAQILGTALTETAGQIAAAFKKFFDKATPTGTINSLPDAVPGANNGLPTTNGTKVNQTVDLTAASVQAIWDALSAALTTANSIGKRIVDYLTGDSYDRLGAPAGASVSADIAAAKVDTAAIKVKTDKLPNVAQQTGSVVDDGLNSSLTFKTDLAFFTLNSFLTFTSGALVGETAQVTSADVGTGFVVTTGYSAEPADGDTFDVINK